MYYFPVEVGSRGICNSSFSKLLASLEIPSGKRKPIMVTKQHLQQAISIGVVEIQRNFDNGVSTTSFLLKGKRVVGCS